MSHGGPSIDNRAGTVVLTVLVAILIVGLVLRVRRFRRRRARAEDFALAARYERYAG